jgi:PAS domain S-box-containing protein
MTIKPTYKELEQRIKELESHLEQKKETLRVIVERNRLATSAAKVGVWDWNIKTGDFYLDPNIKAILGYTDDEIPNDLEIWVEYIHPEDSKAVMEAALDCLDGKTSEYIFEHRMLHKDGSIRWILVRGKAIRDKSGDAVRLIGTDADITDRKQAEEERKKLIKELKAALKEIKTLRGILPLCSYCKRIRNDKGYWEQVDVYLDRHSEADISHGICPECMKEHLPELDIEN